MNRIRKGDEVVIIAGKDKGRRGTVQRVLKDDKIVVQGVNMVKKHQKPNPAQGVSGGIIEKEMPLNLSNVMLYNPATARVIAWVSRFWRTAARSVTSSPTKKYWTHKGKRQWHDSKNIIVIPWWVSSRSSSLTRA